ncbi:MAG TPA: DUF2157 domain-containing protein [Bacillota bacterium]|nr:DUF2157 domain-containing protein [Bacillota bacterium]
MRYSDIAKIRQAGLITETQQQEIVAHFQLKEEGSRFLTIISFVGAALVVCGIVLLLAANWEEIPRGVKIAGGLMLMLGAHAGGWYLREVKEDYRKSGEALHLVGAGLFLGNIALVGQIYHLSSRVPNAFLLWWAGIAALPWLLRSKALHLLSLLAFGWWFGLEVNQEGSWLFFGHDEFQVLLYALLGLLYLGGGYCLRRTRFSEFAPATEKLGLLGFLAFAYPLTWGALYRSYESMNLNSRWLFPALAVGALAIVAVGVANLRSLDRQWRWTWGLALAGAVGLLAGELYLAPHWVTEYGHGHNAYHWVCAVALFVFALLQVQVGVQWRSEFMINLGVIFIGLDILTTYINLFGSMGRTGLVFVLGGVFLMALGIYLERKRRSLMRQIQTPVERGPAAVAN